jgi:hypothetical protein
MYPLAQWGGMIWQTEFSATELLKNVDNEVPGYRKEQETVQINYKLQI